MSVESAGADGASSDSEVQVVEFKLGGESYAIDVSRVSSIVESQKITRLPRTPASVKGIMDLRGETTAVIDPRELLDVVEASGGGGEEQILVLDRPDGKQKVGLLVDDVLDVEDVFPGMVDAVGEIGDLDTKGTRGKLAKGVIRRGEGEEVDLIVWVDVDAVVEEGGT